MEQLSDNRGKINYKVTSYPTVATLKSEPQKSDIRTIQDWHDPGITVKTEPQEDNNPEDPEVILPDWSYLNSESESKVGLTVTMETAEWNFKTTSVGREQLTSVMEASFDPSIEIEDFSIKTEPEEDLSLFVDLKDREKEENKELVRGRIQELTSNQRNNVFKTDGLTSDDQDQLTAAEQHDQESSSKRKAEEFLCEENTCRIMDGSNGSLCRSPEKDTPKEQNICVGLKDYISGCNSKVQNIAYSSKTPFKCDLCRKEIPKSSNEGHYTTMFTGQTPNCTCRKEKCYQCQYSKHRFTERSNICQHIQSIHLKQRLYECHQCGQKFGRKSHMKHHVKSVHLKMQQYDCHHCGKRFYTKDSIKNHVQTVHMKNKQYECQHCGQRFGLKGNLKKHIRRIHLKEKPYECEHCEQKFAENYDRNKHIQIVHLKNKQHECLHCGQRFALKHTMTSHVEAVHLKKKLFKCEICEQSFGLKSIMNAHVKIVHQNKKECSVT